MKSPSDRTATPAGFRRNAWLASIGTGGWFASESVAGFVGIRINVRTARRTIYIGRSVGADEVRAFLLALRKAYRRAGTIWLLADRASGHTAKVPLRRPRHFGSSLSGCRGSGRS